jgi:hypothetical protein
MSKIEIPEDLFESISTLIKYQNILLLKEIAKDNGWKYLDLKKKYLKIEDVGELVKEKNKPKKKKKIKKIKKENVKMVILNEGEEEIECKKYSYMEKEYYVNIKNDNVYDMDNNFVGRLIDGTLNFDEEEI